MTASMSEAEKIAADRAELQAYREQDLLRLMEDISEDCWCAGWMTGNENALYRMAHAGGLRKYGLCDVSDDRVNRLRDLSVLTGKWFVWDDVEGTVAVSLADFARHFPPASTSDTPAP
jgi:hypothetical protein